MNNNDYVQPIPFVPVPSASSAGAVSNASVLAPPVPVMAQPVTAYLPPQNGSLDERQKGELMSQGYTKGMVKAIEDCISAFALRIWVVDNSGSMAASDGNRMIQTKHGEIKSVPCTRWKEIQETVEYHVNLASLLKAPTTFRLLNNPGSRAGQQIFSVADKGEAMIPNDVQIATSTMMNSSPNGVTPLSKHIYEIREQVISLAPQLNAQGCKVAIVLATDGLPTDSSGRGGETEKRNFLEAMRSLEGLPVWIVVRLCTDSQSVVEFYNELDTQLELSVEVLDNFTAEAEEMYRKNKWINYTLPMHRMREMGFQNRLFDLLDERSLTIGELRDFCTLIFGIDQFDGVPDPEVDFNGFLKAVNNMLKKEKNYWHPIKKKLKPLLDLTKMSETYGDGSCAIM